MTTSPDTGQRSISLDEDDLEPRIVEVLDDKQARKGNGPYMPLDEDGVIERLTALIRAAGVEDCVLSNVRRMAGGASKEQFSFELRADGQPPERLVLRMDPLESIVETCRYREDEVFAAVRGAVPTPTTRFLDGDGTYLGRPGIVTSFIDGVTKPPSSGTAVSGVGTTFTPEWREKIRGQFVGNLARLHAFDWRGAELPHFQAPTAHPAQAALWQVNWWSRVWRDDMFDPYPMMTMAERWMRERLPETDELVLLHGDYRVGNFLFDAESGQFNAVLDWELAHIGDFHEDLGWFTQRLFMGVDEHGDELCGDLVSKDDLIADYEAATGRTVDRRKLAFYELLSAYKCAAMNLATGPAAAMRGNNHQDVLLAWLVPVSHTNISDIARIMKEEG
jgi:aminoglycoside phosphotransferase (APT) family kinase protein